MVFFFSQNKTSVNYTATHLFSVVYHMSALICVLDLRINVWWSEIHLWEFHCHIIVLWLYNFAAIQKKQKQAFPQALLCRIIMNFEREVCFAPSQRFDRKLIPKRNPTLDSHLKHGKCWQHRTTGASTKQTSSRCQLQVITNRRRLICRQRLISTPVLRCLSFQTSARHFHYRTKRRHLYHANKWWRTQRR